ncbi:MAG TPA: TadE/TadG family type IV pilus assembly protein [Acidobacteriaceae bacterium]|nr:TadE/TadG family type IV pilus assembly protein [Acidobacteriaceae bacterium]
MITSMHALRRRSESGQSLVELAVALPLFLILILGTAEMANIAWAAVQISNAARAGAQYGSQSHANASDSASVQTAAKNDAPSITNLQVTVTQPCKCISSTGTDTGNACTLAACPSPNVIMPFIQVNTEAAVTPFMRYPGLPASYTLKGQALMGVVK